MKFLRYFHRTSRRSSLLICTLLIALTPALTRADEGVDEIASQEPALEQAAQRPGYESELKDRYSLTDDQIKTLRDRGMNYSQITIAAALAKSSEKPLDDVIKMRLDDKMGWGKIAKSLGLAPKEIGQAISSMHSHRVEKSVEKAEKRAEKKEERKASREERKAERKSKHEERKADRSERREKKGNG